MSDQNTIAISQKYNLPPGLDDGAIDCGFDAATWQFFDAPVFAPSYGNKTVTLDGKTYDVADGTTVRGHNMVHGTQSMVFVGVHSVDDQAFSSSVEASLGLDEVSASTSVSLATTSEIGKDDERTTTVIAYCKEVYSYERDARGDLSADFTAALAALPTAFNPANKAAFIQFFQAWGTHYLTKGHFGGNWVMHTLIDESEYRKLDTSDLKTSVKTSFDDGVSSFSAKTDIEHSTKSSLKIDQNSISIDWHCLGGDSGTELNDWLKTIEDEAELLVDTYSVGSSEVAPRFTPIWDLVDDAARKQAMKDALAAYLPDEGSYAPPLPDPITRNGNENYLADCDGFFSVSLETTGDGNRGDLSVRTDASPEAGTARGGASVQWSDPFDRMQQASAFTPVRANDHYGSSIGSTNGNVSAQAQFQPFPQLGFGDWEEIGGNVVIPGRQQDGFVVAYAGNGGRDQVLGQQSVDGQMVTCAGFSIHEYESSDVWISANSFCMPVPRGSDVMIIWVGEAGIPSTPAGKAYWIPMGDAYRLKPPIGFNVNEVNAAEEDGILLAVVNANDVGEVGLEFPTSYGTLDLQVSGSSDFSDPVSRARAGAEMNTLADKLVPLNSATAMVRKGETFSAAFTQGDDSNAGAVLRWFGIVPA